MIDIHASGSFDNLEKALKRMSNGDMYRGLEKFGAEGVRLLSAATPKDEGLTAKSWSYQIIKTRKSYTIRWKNSQMAGGTPVAILLVYGHSTGTGGYVQGRDFINPVMRPLFDRMAAEAWKVVISK